MVNDPDRKGGIWRRLDTIEQGTRILHIGNIEPALAHDHHTYGASVGSLDSEAVASMSLAG